MKKLYIKEKYLNKLIDIFTTYCPNAQVCAYGSRVNGNAHDGSDLDLVIMNFNDLKKNIAELKQIINDSDIPFLIDIVDYATISKSMQAEIKNSSVQIFPIL